MDDMVWLAWLARAFPDINVDDIRIETHESSDKYKVVFIDDEETITLEIMRKER